MKVGKYNYPNHVMETVKINKNVREEISKFCKKRKISKSKLVEDFYKSILLRYRDGSLNQSNNYVTIHIS